MEKAAGIFLIRKDYKVLICHPTKASKKTWSIPKGRLEEDEHPTEAAVRETFEEANVDVSDWKIMHNLEPIEYKSGKKILYPYVLFENQNNFDFDSFEFKCNTNVPEKIGGYPEMDDYKWVTIDEAKELVHYTQKKCLDDIAILIEKLTKDIKKFRKK